MSLVLTKALTSRPIASEARTFGPFITLILVSPQILTPQLCSADGREFHRSPPLIHRCEPDPWITQLSSQLWGDSKGA
jgi:hypothetical protein